MVCTQDLNHARTDHVRNLLGDEEREISQLEETVLSSLKSHELVSQNLNKEFQSTLSLGERLSDRISEFGGSWRFIILFGVILLLWIIANSIALLGKPFDPYPYILLNLVLSCIAAIQAPIIMMSQNRQEAKDRLRAEHDYRTNLKAELEIRHANIKLDQLLSHQWHRLMEIQQIQMQMIEESQKKR